MAISVKPDPQDLMLPDATPQVPDHPSYTYAKTGLVWESEPVPQAHLDRNQWEERLVPEDLPAQLPFTDARTGLTWVEDNSVGEFMYHGNNDCIRAPIDPARVDALRADPDYRDAFQSLASAGGLTVDQAVPSAQACYDPSNGQLVTNGPYVGTWDYANPDTPGQSHAHWEMDMAPDGRADNYTPVPLEVSPGSYHSGGGDASSHGDSGASSGGSSGSSSSSDSGSSSSSSGGGSSGATGE